MDSIAYLSPFVYQLQFASRNFRPQLQVSRPDWAVSGPLSKKSPELSFRAFGKDLVAPARSGFALLYHAPSAHNACLPYHSGHKHPGLRPSLVCIRRFGPGSLFATTPRFLVHTHVTGRCRNRRGRLRRRKLRIPRPAACARASSLRCASSPQRNRCAGFPRGPRCRQADKPQPQKSPELSFRAFGNLF